MAPEYGRIRRRQECIVGMLLLVSNKIFWEHPGHCRLQVSERRRGLNKLFMLIIWCLWKEQNARLFDRKSDLP